MTPLPHLLHLLSTPFPLSFLLATILNPHLLMLPVVDSMKYDQVNHIKQNIAKEVLDWYENGTRVLIGGAVRLAFHDCVGGCDGCVNHGNIDNSGLKRYTDRLEPLYAKYKVLLSRADFYALAAITALDLAQQIDVRYVQSFVRHSVKFRFGRVDCPTSPVTDESKAFPSPITGLKHGTEYFQNVFDLNQQQFVAVLGAHTLGHTHTAHSGFGDLKWVKNSEKLDNEFYIDLVKSKWVNASNYVGSGKLKGHRPFWTQPAEKITRIMLNSDLAFYLDFGADNTSADALPINQCTYETCPKATTSDLVEQYAKDNAKWFEDFSFAYQKLIETGAANLAYPEGEEGEKMVVLPGYEFLSATKLAKGHDTPDAAGMHQNKRAMAGDGQKLSPQFPTIMLVSSVLVAMGTIVTHGP